MFKVGKRSRAWNVSAADIAPLPAALHEQLAGFDRAHVRDVIRGPY